jgi:hypothetical protein
MYELGRCIKQGLRTLFIVNLVSVLMYMAYRVHVWTTTNTVTDNRLFLLFLICQSLNMGAMFVIVRVPGAASQALDLSLLLTSLNVIIDGYTLSYVLTTRYIDETIVINATFLCADIVCLFLLLYIRFAFARTDWDQFERQVNAREFDDWDTLYTDLIFKVTVPPATPGVGGEIAPSGGVNLRRVRARDNELALARSAAVKPAQKTGYIQAKPAFAFGVIMSVMVVEFVLVYYYILITLSIPATISASGAVTRQFSGWLYLLHGMTMFGALTWVCARESLVVVHDAYQWLLGAAFALLLLDICQLIYVKGNDVGTLIALRVLLMLCAAAYAFAIIYSGVEFVAPARGAMLFYTLRLAYPALITAEAALVAFYFIYAVAVDLQVILYYNLFHLLTVFAAFATVAMASRTQTIMNGIAATTACAGILILYETFILGYLPNIPGYQPTEYAIQVPLVLISLIYVVIFFVTWPGTRDEDVVAYRRIAFKEKMTMDFALKFVFARDNVEGKLTELEGDMFGAEKVYFVATNFIRTTWIVEFVLTYLLLLILIVVGATTSSSSALPWYIWFYMVHWLSVLAGATVVTFQFDTEMVLTFGIVSILICLIADIILVCFVPGYISSHDGRPSAMFASIVALESLYIIVDVCALAFYGLLWYGLTPDAFLVLMTMRDLSSRVTLSYQIIS